VLQLSNQNELDSPAPTLTMVSPRWVTTSLWNMDQAAAGTT
jgi:hypothetical protein